MELERIYQEDFRKEWVEANANPDAKFSLRAQTPLKSYHNGYNEVNFAEPQSEFWCHLWQGKHGIFGKTELIPNTTVVSGTSASPLFFTPADVIEKFWFSDLNPITGEWEKYGTKYRETLKSLKAGIYSKGFAMIAERNKA